MKQSRLGIRIAGPAGLGMHSVMDIVANAFASLGYSILTDSEYQSIIKGGVNYYDVNICVGTPFLARSVDILIALNDKNILPNLADISEGGYIIASKKWIDLVEKTVPDVRIRYQVIDPEITDKYENTYLVGILAGILGVPASVFESYITKAFLKKGEEIVQKNKDILHEYARIGAEHHTGEMMLPKLPEGISPKNVIYGNRAIAYGAIASELEFFSAYPMTPASTILTEIVNSKKVTYLQAEDEIAVMNAALGASFTGARAMVGTSGGGFALMTEALSFAAQAEFPIVAVLSQRAGPSTGTPTYHEQSEISYALVPTFGGGDHVVLIPSTMEEGYAFGGLALNIAQKYQTTVIILTDKQFSEGKVSVNELSATPVHR